MNKTALYALLVTFIALGIWSSNHLTYNYTVDPLVFGTESQKDQFKKYQNAFESDREAVTIGLKSSKKFTEYSHFLKVQEITLALNSLSGVEEVVSLESIKLPALNGFRIDYSNVLSLENEFSFNEDYRYLNEYQDITEKFLSTDRKAISFYVYLHNENQEASIDSIKNILKASPFDEYHILGSPVFESEGDTVLKKETILITLLGIFLLLLSMAWLTRSVRKIFLTLLFTAFNVCVTIVFMKVCNFEITSFTTIVPIVIAILSFTDITHILYHYELLAVNDLSIQKIRKQLFKKIGFPLLLTSLSNLFGFAIFFFNDSVDQITDLAIVASFGILFAYVSSRLLLPTLLDYKANISSNQKTVFIDMVILGFVTFASKHYKKIVSGCTILFIFLGLYVFMKAEIDMHYYEKDNTSLAINRACAFYDQNFQGIRDIEVVLNTSQNSVFDAATIKKIDDIEQYLTNQYGCKSVYSVNTIIKRYNRFKNNGAVNFYRLPKNVTSKFISNLNSDAEQLNLYNVLSIDESMTRVIGSIPDIGTHDALLKNEELTNFLSQMNAPNMEVYINGKAYIFDQNVFKISKFVMICLLIGILFVGILVTILFQSFWMGMITVVSNVLPLLFGVTVMSLLNVPLNPSSIFILTLLFGIALDDSIYLLTHLNDSKRKRASTRIQLIKSLKANSSPLLITSVVLSIMFLSLTISSYDSLLNFGLIISSGLIFAFISDMLLIPSLLFLRINQNS
ncbi:hypothetical protein LX97_02214 [Nonlabens dokdonensis]|uniref:SSD domain-containing protein n=2 Tax=Nonlabens dokdonensis TaxID=328515 RepID=A0ABX5PXL0_9FLAO|nr:MMPL family transporter [Nonlabens dokdonensis]AGC77594.1 putative efflux transporter, RND superfamily [Nonlabens dokdonensis DSW-6]PZX39856.1 hypothetical protein LX97_02214 [Nonlabens dokdonensis]